MTTVSIRVFLVALALISAPTLVSAQTPSQPTESPRQPPGESIELPVSIEKIQKAVSRPPAIIPRTDRVVFRVEVFSKPLTIEDILGPDYLKGPVPYGGMTHQEFLNMVTPNEFKGYAVFTNAEGLMVAATAFALQWALNKAIDKLKEAKTERAKEAARKEVLDALNELDAARKKAGLPPKR